MLFDPPYLSHYFSLIIWLCFALLAQSTTAKTGPIARTNIPKQLVLTARIASLSRAMSQSKPRDLSALAPADTAELLVAGDRFSASSRVPEHEVNGAHVRIEGEHAEEALRRLFAASRAQAKRQIVLTSEGRFRGPRV